MRGVRLAEGDRVVSMAVIRHSDASPEQRAAYLKQRRLMAGVTDEDGIEDDEDSVAEGQLSPEDYAAMSAAEDLILTVTVGGSGKLSSSHDYPVRGRGGQGVKAISPGPRGGRIIAAFPVDLGDQIMLATSTGQSIRVPVDQISFRSRSAGGVRVFNVGADEEVVSVARVAEQGDEAEGGEAAES